MVLLPNGKIHMLLARAAIVVLEYNVYSSPKNVLFAFSVFPIEPNIPVEAATLSFPCDASSLCRLI